MFKKKKKKKEKKKKLYQTSIIAKPILVDKNCKAKVINKTL